ncbi:MAG: four helix bundle protein [Chitinophagales bacterium]|nr:four helix bundle protein [Chitinophagales bacterium]
MLGFQNLEVWNESMALAKEVYTILKKYPKDELFILVSQIKRSAVSIPSNIAEGIGRQYKNETIHFLSIARGSLYELDTQIRLSGFIGYINKPEECKILNKIEMIKRLLNGLIRHYNTASLK